jgi:alpha-N-arabinofuranosidase
VLQSAVTTPTYETSWFGEVPVLDSVAVESEDGSGVTIFAVNRDQHEALPLQVDLRGYPELRTARHTYVTGDDPEATNTMDNPNRVTPQEAAPSAVDGGTLNVSLPPLSWSMIRVGR